MQWYHPKPIAIPHWFQRWAAFDCVADADGSGFSLIVPTYFNTLSKARPVRVVVNGMTRTVEPDNVQCVERIGMPILVHYSVDLATADNISIQIRGRRRPIQIDAMPPQPKPIRIAMSTMFRPDYWALPLWIDHYRRLGVEWFFLYFNGKRRRLEAHLSALDDFDFSECTFVEWKFTKRVHKRFVLRGRRIQTAIGAHPNPHHAQTAEMLHASVSFARHWAIPWLAYFDLDEYLVLHRWRGLHDFLADDSAADINLFECRWAEEQNEYYVRERPFKRKFKQVLARASCQGPVERTKLIVRADKMILPDIHRPAMTTPDARWRTVPPGKAHFLHFHHFNSDRADSFSDRDSWQPISIDTKSAIGRHDP